MEKLEGLYSQRHSSATLLPAAGHSETWEGAPLRRWERCPWATETQGAGRPGALGVGEPHPWVLLAGHSPPGQVWRVCLSTPWQVFSGPGSSQWSVCVHFGCGGCMHPAKGEAPAAPPQSPSPSFPGTSQASAHDVCPGSSGSLDLVIFENIFL